MLIVASHDDDMLGLGFLVVGASRDGESPTAFSVGEWQRAARPFGECALLLIKSMLLMDHLGLCSASDKREQTIVYAFDEETIARGERGLAFGCSDGVSVPVI